MFNIAIVDDNKIICSQIENILIDYQKQNNVDMNIFVFSSGEEFWAYLNRSAEIDLLFLDIELFELTGIDVGKKIREELQNQKMEIIFISYREQYAMELFNIHPFNFLIKPLNSEIIIKNMELALNINEENPSCFVYKMGKETKKILAENIQYFESIGHQIKMYTVQGYEVFYGKLDEIYKDLNNKNFLFIHKSYLVNYKYVKVFSYESITLKSGFQLPISQSRRKSIRRQILVFEKEGVLLWD